VSVVKNTTNKIDMTHNKHTHEWNDKGGVYYTCPLQQKQECACGATRYIQTGNNDAVTIC